MRLLILKKARNDAKKYGKEKQFNKQIKNLKDHGTTYNSLNFEVYSKTKKFKDPHRAYSFRVTGKYRAYCNKPDADTIRIFLVDPHRYPL